MSLSCSICDSTFSNNSSLEVHYNYSHGNPQPDNTTSNRSIDAADATGPPQSESASKGIESNNNHTLFYNKYHQLSAAPHHNSSCSSSSSSERSPPQSAHTTHKSDASGAKVMTATSPIPSTGPGPGPGQDGGPAPNYNHFPFGGEPRSIYGGIPPPHHHHQSYNGAENYQVDAINNNIAYMQYRHQTAPPPPPPHPSYYPYNGPSPSFGDGGAMPPHPLPRNKCNEHFSSHEMLSHNNAAAMIQQPYTFHHNQRPEPLPPPNGPNSEAEILDLDSNKVHIYHPPLKRNDSSPDSQGSFDMWGMANPLQQHMPPQRHHLHGTPGPQYTNGISPGTPHNYSVVTTTSTLPNIPSTSSEMDQPSSVSPFYASGRPGSVISSTGIVENGPPNDVPNTSNRGGGGGGGSSSSSTPPSKSSSKSPRGTTESNWKSNESRRAKTYKCTACNKWFTSSGHLKRHYNTTLHRNAVKQSGLEDPATKPVANYHFPNRDPSYVADDGPSPAKKSKSSSNSSKLTVAESRVPASSSSPTSTPDMPPLPPYRPGSVGTGGHPNSPFMNIHHPNLMAGPPPELVGGLLPPPPPPHHLQHRRPSYSLGPSDQNSMVALKTEQPNCCRLHIPQQHQVSSTHQVLDTTTICNNYFHHPTMDNTNNIMGDSINTPSNTTVPAPQQSLNVMSMSHHPNFQSPHVSTTTLSQPQQFIQIPGNSTNDHQSSSSYLLRNRALREINNNNMHTGFAGNVGGAMKPSPFMHQSIKCEPVVSGDNDEQSNELEDILCDDQSLSPLINTCNSAAGDAIVSSTQSIVEDAILVCPHCGKNFKRKCYLTQHVQSNHGIDKPFRCLKCGKRFGDSKKYKLHEGRHNSIKPFKCELCPCAFHYKVDLKRHRYTHSPQRPFACKFCDKGFIRNDHKNKHEESHGRKSVKVKQQVGKKSENKSESKSKCPPASKRKMADREVDTKYDLQYEIDIKVRSRCVKERN